ncbi:hypothetical protein [Acidovorax sp. SUPP2539]|nr:hypothetical protein [Acidovorax sp. SUPP2539]GKS91241.1 hypothetical protein AVTE2539_17770 [Acidovorax sp. SUPP2539]
MSTAFLILAVLCILVQACSARVLLETVFVLSVLGAVISLVAKG